MALSKLEYYKRRYNRAYSLAAQWMAIQQTCQHYCIPSRNIFYQTNTTQGVQKNAKVYDTTAVAATRTFVAKVQNALTPPQQVWAYLEAGSEITKEEHDHANKYLQDTTDKIFDYIRHSNFDLAVNECYYDLAVGTAILCINEGPDEEPLKFYSIPLAQMAFEESINGYIESSYRTWGEVRISEIQVMWPNAVLPPHLIQQADMDPNASVKNIYEGVVYMNGEKNPFRYVLWIDSEILLEEESTSSPWVVFRWSKVNQDIMGRGVAMDALPSILSLNELARLEITSANLNVCKPYMAYSDGVFNPWTFKLEPNTIIPVSPNSAGQFPIQPLPDVANPQFYQIQAMDLRQQINKLMFAEPLGPVNDAPGKTATELAIRQRSLAEEIGPLFTRMQQEFLSRVIQRIIHILQLKGIIDPLIINGKEIKIRYQSPLVVAQGTQDVQTFMQYFQVLQQVLGPDVAVVTINPVELPFWIANKMGIDKNILPTKEGLEETLRSQSEMAQEQQMMEMQGGQLGQ